MHLQQYFLSQAALDRLPGWWEDIDDDPKWQEYVFVVLSAAYGLLTFVALVQLVRIQRRVPEYGWTTQKVFHLLNAFVCLLRCIVFALRDKVGSPSSLALLVSSGAGVEPHAGLLPCCSIVYKPGLIPLIAPNRIEVIVSTSSLACVAQVQDIQPDALQYVLLDLPGLLFFTTYTLLVLFWAEIYHQARTPHTAPACL